MLAGRKLLLADDSATIQKVIDLTFADEGVRVIAVSSGREALEQLEEFAPDIVLADVHMPSPSGYEVCEYVKTNEKLKHVPVMLLVGSFEPFDEAEARRVGADDILTKPFQSIRRLIDRVGALVSSPPAEKAPEKEAATAELPRTDEEPVEEPRLNTKDLEITTADTLPLEAHPFADTLPRIEPVVVSEPAVVSEPTPSARLEALLSEPQQSSEGTSEHEGTMEPVTPEMNSESRGGESSPDVLLDLGELETARAVESDDFILDLDDDQESAPAPMRAFVEPEMRETVAAASAYESSYQPSYQPGTYESDSYSSFAETQEVPYASAVESVAVPPELTPDPVPVFGETEFPVADTPRAAATAAAQSFTADQLSPEMIDAIARRAVELMSDKVIREIAWEVVPDLAELLIKRQLEERQAK
ncbi:MAG TPA: response regulator, partial [Pyrinomonadaceae bacterium]|nr:response regulator [Pyrinomonadaceae bacterium]